MIEDVQTKTARSDNCNDENISMEKKVIACSLMASDMTYSFAGQSFWV